jgi:hypothetical protein
MVSYIILLSAEQVARHTWRGAGEDGGRFVHPEDGRDLTLGFSLSAGFSESRHRVRLGIEWMNRERSAASRRICAQ